MTEKQKKAIKILNRLLLDTMLNEIDYFFLLDCILAKEHDTWIPYNAPKLPCLEPDGVCSNPFRDCVNCPRIFSSGGTTITTTDDQIARPYKHFGFDIGDPKGDIGIMEDQQ